MIKQLIQILLTLLQNSSKSQQTITTPIIEQEEVNVVQVIEIPLLAKVAYRGMNEVHLSHLIHTFNDIFPEFGITTPERIAGFISQVAHETGGFKWLTELGGRSYFKKYDAGTRIGKRLGNTIKGDGYKFRGRGLIQLTGRYNYTQFNQWLKDRGYDYDVITNPNQVSDLPLAVLAAVFYWDSRNLNRFCDKKDIKGLTRTINGGYNGLRDRVSKYEILINGLRI